MKFYVDFDDCLCETASALSVMAGEMFDKAVPYENIGYFDLKKSFHLTDEEYEKLMIAAHYPEVLMDFEETTGASEVLNELIDKGHEVFIITGRPITSYDVSRKWLDEHGLTRVNLFFLDKYGRNINEKDNKYNLEPDDFYKMHFDYAIEDSPVAFKFFEHLPDLKVMVFDRPWNKGAKFPNANYSRCAGWEAIRNKLNGGV